MIIATIIMSGVKINSNYSKAQIEQKARSMGMEYPDEVRVLPRRSVEQKK